MSAHDKFTVQLGEATIVLYPADASGNPITASPLWTGACEDGLRIAERWLVAETRPTGRSHPRRRPLVAQYDLEIDRVWVLRQANPEDFRTTHERYVMDILWMDAVLGHWHRKVFYGVTVSERDWSSRAAEEPFIDGQKFQAEYYVATSGTGTPPAISDSAPLTVWWVASEGIVQLYTHDPTTYQFTEAGAGVTTGRATVVYDPDQTGDFEVTFATGTTLALQIVGEEVRAGDFIQGAPTAADLPRVDFRVGAVRVASVTLAKKFFANDFTQQDEPADSANHFLIRSASDLVLKIGAAGAVADDFAQAL